MVGEVDRFEAWAVPRVEFLNHVLLFDLVDDDVKHVELCKDAHLELATPLTRLSHCVDVFVNVFVFFDEPFVLLLVDFEVVTDLLSEELMLLLFAEDLVTHSSE